MPMRHKKFPPCCAAGWEHLTEYFVFSTVYLTGGTSHRGLRRLFYSEAEIIASLCIYGVLNPCETLELRSVEPTMAKSMINAMSEPVYPLKRLWCSLPSSRRSFTAKVVAHKRCKKKNVYTMDSILGGTACGTDRLQRGW